MDIPTQEEHEEQERIQNEKVEDTTTRTSQLPAPDIPEPKPEITEHHVRKTTDLNYKNSTQSSVGEENQKTYEDTSAMSKFVHEQTHESFMKPRREEEASSTGTSTAKPITDDTSFIGGLAHNEEWHREQNTARNKSEHEKFARKKNVTEIPQPENKSSYRADPRTEGTPIDSPMFAEQKNESIFQKIAEAPRRAKEKAEEFGYSAQQKYHNTREAPLQKKAEELYDSRMAENDLKYHRGEISGAMHKTRQQQYLKDKEQSSIPLEKRIIGDPSNDFKGGMVRNVTEAFITGAGRVQKNVSEDYRSSPAPKIKGGQGIVFSQIGKIGIPPVKTVTRKGKQVGAQPTQPGINFGGGMHLGSMDSPINFGGMFSRPEPEKKKKR